jgi:hypothetical protein
MRDASELLPQTAPGIGVVMWVAPGRSEFGSDRESATIEVRERGSEQAERRPGATRSATPIPAKHSKGLR